MDEPLDNLDLHSPNLRVIRHGFVPDVAATFHQVTVAVSPLISGGGVRMKNLFLAGQRKAIVTTPLGNQGIDFESGRSAEVCATGTEMARAIERLLDDPRSATEIANAGYEHVKRQFTAAAVLDRYRKLVFAS
jgi:glycosyltransferase involved in cell wall biosynthesis